MDVSSEAIIRINFIKIIYGKKNPVSLLKRDAVVQLRSFRVVTMIIYNK